MSRAPLAAALLAAAACFPTTTRPPFASLPAAQQAELELPVPQATRETALALHADSIPVERTEPKDGWLESEWFDPITLQPTAARHIGPNVVKVRAFVGPSRPNFSLVQIEAVYIPYADPSRDERTLEREVPDSSAAGKRVAAVLAGMARQYGDSAARAGPVPASSGVSPAAPNGSRGHD